MRQFRLRRSISFLHNDTIRSWPKGVLFNRDDKSGYYHAEGDYDKTPWTYELLVGSPAYFEPVADIWKPQEGEEFYYVASDGDIVRVMYRENEGDFQDMRQMGNVFQTRDGALEARDRIRSVLLNLHLDLADRDRVARAITVTEER